MSGPTKPSTNLSYYNSLPGMMKAVLDNFLMGLDDMLPAAVVSFDRDANLAQVQPLIMMIKTDGTIQSRAPVASVPVAQLGGGGFMLNFNLSPGDLGFIKSNDRDISIFMQSFKESVPNTYRKHKFSDAVFIPCPMHGMTINDEDQSHVVLSTTDGTQRVSIWQNRVKITSDTRIVIDAPITEFSGSAQFSGNITTTGDVIAKYQVTGEEVSLLHHTHNGVMPGGGDTGEPNGT